MATANALLGYQAKTVQPLLDRTSDRRITAFIDGEWCFGRECIFLRWAWVIYDTRVGGIMQVQQRQESVGSFGLTLAWLLWLLPGLGVVAVVLWLLSAAGGLDVPAMARLVATGHGGQVLGYLFGLIWWGLSVTGQAALDH